ncbi:MAG: YdiU family protein [Spirochaetes bacterium]|nr:YdiU family protein [Spirochaetota bacterium]
MPRSTEAAITQSIGFHFDNTYTKLPELFFQPAKPANVASPQLVIFNRALADVLAINYSNASDAELAQNFSGAHLPAGAEPIAQAYAGHQFGHFTLLGDGRAILLGEHTATNAHTSLRWDIQLKGAGATAYSRRGDGKAALAPMLREYIISEALAALGIPTTRSLAVVATGESVYRETVLPGAVLTRVAASHLRVGTFEYAAALGSEQNDIAPLKILVDYAIQRHYVGCLAEENPYRAFFDAVAERQAQLIARWQGVGFIHGVMNTDNMAISGESIDFGPCAFMDAYNPATVFSSIDTHGRYAYANQPRIAAWNLARFAETLLALFSPDETEALALGKAALERFHERMNLHWLNGMRNKLGLTAAHESDFELLQALFNLMHQHAADFTNTFRALAHSLSGLANVAPLYGNEPGIHALFIAMEFHSWHERWQTRLKAEGQPIDTVIETMNAVNPAVIARNHNVEAALAAATTGDLVPLDALLTALREPFVETEANRGFREGAPPSGTPYRTFCGT